MKKILVLEFNPLMVILLILAAIIPVSITGMSPDPASATVANCSIISPTTLVPVNARVNGSIPIDFTFNLVNNVTETHIVNVMLIKNGSVIYTLNPLPVNNPLTPYTAHYEPTVTTGIADNTYDLQISVYQSTGPGSGTSTLVYSPVISSCVVINSTAVPTAPTNPLPACGSGYPANNPTFSWTHTLATGETYTLQHATASSFSGYTEYTNIAANLKAVAGLSNGTNYWRVKTVDKYGNPSAWLSCSLCIDTVIPAPAPIPSAPPNTTTPLSASYNPTLTWSASTDATSCSAVRYWVQVSQDSTFATFSENISALQILSYTPVTNLGTGTWYWHVQAYDLAWNLSGWSATWAFAKPIVTTSYPITLGGNWNLISPPLYPTYADNITKIFEGTDNISLVMYYDPTYTSGASAPWRIWVPPPYTGTQTLTTFQAGKAYWVQMDPITGIKTLTISGTQQRGAPSPEDEITLYAGWNMVGYKSVIQRTACDYFSAIQTKIAALYYYAGNLVPIDKCTGTMMPGNGYWIYMIEQGRFFLPGQ
jgi:hypothetical protein